MRDEPEFDPGQEYRVEDVQPRYRFAEYASIMYAHGLHGLVAFVVHCILHICSCVVWQWFHWECELGISICMHYICGKTNIEVCCPNRCTCSNMITLSNCVSVYFWVLIFIDLLVVHLLRRSTSYRGTVFQEGECDFTLEQCTY